MDPVLDAVQALRQDVTAMRAELVGLRVDTGRLAEVAISARRELEQHRADDRRELDLLHNRTQKLSTRQWMTVVVVTLLAAGSGAGAGAATAAQVMGG